MHTDDRCGIEVPHRRIKRYDGQMVWVDGHDGAAYELGNYLGGGAAGVVYESINLKSYEHVAMKVLNPIGYKCMPNSTIQRCTVVKKGSPVELAVVNGNKKMVLDHVWWVRHPSTQEVLGAYCDPHGKLRGLSLRQCIDIWGWNPKSCGIDAPSSATLNIQNSRILFSRGIPDSGPGFRRLERRGKAPDHDLVSPPNQYLKFVKNRQCIYKEICNMSKLNGHQNVLQLTEVLEYVQDSKSTIFLALELAAGGELFDRITIDRGTEEDTARQYYRQLLCGIQYCHLRGVCHRDLKPENLLLADNEDHPRLKIADFGLSALFRNGVILPSEAEQSIRRLRSVVGSPHYVAPEILTDNRDGYEGAKADVWSSGVILYAMLAGNLPFGKEILQCPRFVKWNEWSSQRRLVQGTGNHCVQQQQQQLQQRHLQHRHFVPVSRAGWSEQWQQWQQRGGGVGSSRVPYPTWFFPGHFSPTARQLLTELLDPDPDTRISVQEALQHLWLQPEGEPERVPTIDAAGSGSARKVSCSDHERPQGADAAVVSTVDVSIPSVVTRSVMAAAAPNNGAVAHDQACGAVSVSMAVLPDAATAPPASEQAAPVGGDDARYSSDQHDRSRPPAAKIAPEIERTQTQQPQPQPQPAPVPSQPEQETKESGPISTPSKSQTDDQVMMQSPDSVSPSNVTPNTTPRRRRKRSTLSFSSPPLAPMASRGALQPDAFALDGSSTSGPAAGGLPPDLPLVILPSMGSMGSLRAMGHGCLRIDAAAASAPCQPQRRESPSTSNDRGTADRHDVDVRDAASMTPIGLGLSRSMCGGSTLGSAGGDIATCPLAVVVAPPMSPPVSGADAAHAPSSPSRSSRLEMLPLFKDLVKRSTRFSTAVPASEVLHKIAHIIEKDAHPLPYPFRHITQRVTPDWNAYKLEVTRGGVRICTVRVFQLRAGLYMVEFLRGQMDTFQFKRFYEHIRLELSEVVKNDYTLQLLDAHSPHSHRLRRGHLERSQSC